MPGFSRREFTLGSAVAASALFADHFAAAFPAKSGESVLQWLDQPAENTDPNGTKQLLVWEDVVSTITPNDRFFGISHFNWPEIDGATWRLEIDGLVRNPLSLSLDDIRSRPRQEVTFTLECSGNSAFPDFVGGIGTARWAGTPLKALLDEAGVLEKGIEVVFWGTDVGDVQLHDSIRDVTMHQNFARSMSIDDAMNPDNILCYEMNGVPLPPLNGFPLRLITPGWYGIANVKWLKRIEIRDRRFMSLLMARNYVTIREEDHDGETVGAETSVGRVNLKSAPVRVTRLGDRYRIVGVAWGAPIAKVEVRIDDGPWTEAALEPGDGSPYVWRFWSLDWADPAGGEHRITSRAIDTDGNMQPAPDDSVIARKHTYWEANGQITRRIAIP